jgi:hypothetical protein
MSIDITKTISELAKAAGSSLGEDGPVISSAMTEVLHNNQQSIAELVQARVDSEINDEDFSTELAREKLIVEAEMIALEIAGKASIQKAINDAMEVLTKSVDMAT